MKPRCYDCLSEDVTVKVTDTFGFDHWFCARDWAYEQDFHEKITQLLRDVVTQLEAGA